MNLVSTISHFNEFKENFQLKCHDLRNDFSNENWNKILKINHKFYTMFHIEFINWNSIKLYATEIFTSDGCLDIVFQEIKFDDFQKGIEVDISELNDNSFYLEGKTLEDLNDYLKAVGFDTKITHGNHRIHDMRPQSFEFDVSTGRLILKIYDMRAKNSCKKFSVMYNQMCKINMNDKPVYIIYCGGFGDDEFEAKRISFDVHHDRLKIT